MLFEAVRLLDEVRLEAPVKAGQVVVPNVLGTGADHCSHPQHGKGTVKPVCQQKTTALSWNFDI